MARPRSRRFGVYVTALVLATIVGSGAARAQLDPGVRDHVLPASVQIAIQVQTTENGQTRPEFVPVGSGTVVSPTGLILTNWHVVDTDLHRAQLDLWEAQGTADGGTLAFELDETTFLVLTTEGAREPHPEFSAQVLAEHHALDFAVLQVTADAFGSPVDPASLNLSHVPVGDSSVVRHGDPVHVFGYPAIGGGTLQYTAGVVSGFGYEDGIDGAAWITTDASVSGGSSGGTAVDSAGRMIGVPTAGGQLDCRPGDTNSDGVVTAEDVGCIPTGGSLGVLRPIDLAKPMLLSVGWEANAGTDEPAEVVTPVPTNALAPTSTSSPAPTPSTTQADAQARRCQASGYPQSGQVVVAAVRTNLYAEPRLNAEHIAILLPGTRLVAVSDSRVRVDLFGQTGCDWVAVIDPNTEVRGFVRARSLGMADDEREHAVALEAQATIVAQATRIAELEAAQAEAQATATALAGVVASSVLDPNRQSITIQTDLGGILDGDEEALEEARGQLSTQLSRYPIGCRAGFVLISGNAPDIGQGIELAERVEALLREYWPDIFTEATGAEQFALPNVQPFGEVTADIFFYSGCEPIS